MPTKKEYYVIDGNAYIYRAFFALPPFTTSYGLPTNAVFGFTKMLLGLIKTKPKAKIIVAFDHKKKSFRHEVYQEYKAHRAKMPEEMVAQLPAIKELPDLLCLPDMEIEGVEADDAIASFVTQQKEKEPDALFYIITGDKDMMQLVEDGHVFIYDTMKNVIYDRQAVKAKMGVFPEQIPDLLGMMGDSSDNIPGIPGVGPKTAQKLLEQYGTLEETLEKAEEQKGALKEKLIANKELGTLSKELATVKKDIDLSHMDLSDKERCFDRMQDFCRKYEFGSLLKEVMELANSTSTATSKEESVEKVTPTEFTEVTADLVTDTLHNISSPCFVEVHTEEGQYLRFSYGETRQVIPCSSLTAEHKLTLLDLFNQEDFIVISEDVKVLWKLLHTETVEQVQISDAKPQPSLF